MSSQTIFPAALSGELCVPGDKSVSQRIAMLAGLATGTTVIKGFLTGEDAMSTLRAVCALGASYRFDGDLLKITGSGGKIKEPANPLDMGNSGTGTRLLAGLLAGRGITIKMIGDASLSRRPMGRIQAPLKLMGAQMELTGEKGTLPLTLHGATLKGIRYELPMASAQVKSCVLLAGLFAEGKTTVVEPRPTRDHTEKLFQTLDIPIEVNGLEISLQGFGPAGPKFDAKELTVPGDISSAAFWIAAVAARPGATLTIHRVGLNPRRTAILDVLKRMGASIETKRTEDQSDPVGTVIVKGAALKGTVICGDEIPNLIDELPVISAIAALAEGETVIRDAAELRVKESDRIAIMTEHLKAFGVNVTEQPDGMTVTGPTQLKSPAAPLASDGDHRIAMSIAVLATFGDQPVTVENTACVDTSYPEFWSHLKQLGGRVE